MPAIIVFNFVIDKNYGKCKLSTTVRKQQVIAYTVIIR